jgi:hypothetical protein
MTQILSETDVDLDRLIVGMDQITRASKLSGEYLFEIDGQPLRIRAYRSVDGKYWAALDQTAQASRAAEPFYDRGHRYETEEAAVRAVLDLLSLISIK